ncbi:caldesmon-like [Poeciliopsis prolifica]|uniref:caldesmon-like n=1 Tax=Poeciliopsis prolifica TaxID=188132 RepID=UPI0024132956|nr:caldesmon-like [Poeciliopsis prolifica]
MKRNTVILPSYCWYTIQQMSRANDLVGENCQKNFDRLRPKFEILEAKRTKHVAKKEAEKLAKEQGFDRIAEEERQFVEQEQRALIEKSKYKMMQRDKGVENFNRELSKQGIKEFNKVLAAYQRDKRTAAEKLAKESGEINSWNNAADERIKNEEIKRKQTTRANADEYIGQMREHKQIAEQKRLLGHEETRQIMLKDAYINQRENEDREKRREMERDCLQQNPIKQIRSKMEQLEISRKEDTGNWGDFLSTTRNSEKYKADRLRETQMKIQNVYDKLAEIKKEENSKLASRENRINKLDIQRRMKEKQREEEEQERKATTEKSLLETNTYLAREKLEEKQTDKEKSRKRLYEMREADKLYAAEEEKKYQQKRQITLDCSEFNLRMAAEKRAKERNKKNTDMAEQRSLHHSFTNPSDTIKEYMKTELQKAQDRGLDVQYIQSKFRKPKPPPKVGDSCRVLNICPSYDTCPGLVAGTSLDTRPSFEPDPKNVIKLQHARIVRHVPMPKDGSLPPINSKTPFN